MAKQLILSIEGLDDVSFGKVKSATQMVEYIIEEYAPHSYSSKEEVIIAKFEKLTSITSRMFSLMIDKGLINEEEASEILGETITFK